jgi:hypothetical protein
LGEQGRLKAQTKYSWSAVADRVVLHYNRLLNRMATAND